MTSRRALAGALLGLAVAAVAPVTAANAAAPGYPQGNNPSITLSSSVVTVGSTITVSGSGFAADTSVAVTTAAANQGFAGRPAADATLGSFRPADSAAPAVQRLAATTALATVTTNGSGSFATLLTFNQVGVFVVTASGLAADGSTGAASGTITVLAASSPGGGNNNQSGGSSSNGGGLPNTGASIGLPLTGGVILVLVGAGLVTMFRRRHRGDAGDAVA